MRKAGSLLPLFLLALYDGDLAQQLRVTGSCRQKPGEKHDLVILLGGLLLALASFFDIAAGPHAMIWLGLPLVWLASTRLESCWSCQELMSLIIGCVLASMVTVGVSSPLPVLITALAVAQAAAEPKLRPMVLTNFRVPMVVRSSAVVLAGIGLGGTPAILPSAIGAAAAGWVTYRKRAA
jgi:hypothetical protein